MRAIYKSVMDSEFNGLRLLPKNRRLQIMIYLSVMWTMVFCAVTGIWLLFGPLLVGHLLIVLATCATALTLNRETQLKTYRDQPRSDSTARYDDVWGG